MKDLRPQKNERSPEDVLKHLKETTLETRFSARVWYFYPAGGRFHEAYIEKGSIEDTLNKIAWMHDGGYIDSSFGVKAHYPNEVNRGVVEDVLMRALAPSTSKLKPLP